MSTTPDAETTDDESAIALKYKEALLAETREELQKADAKASILLAASGIALSALAAAFAAGTWSPARLSHHDARIMAWAAIILSVLGFLILGAAVYPRLRKEDIDEGHPHYFGDVEAFWRKRHKRGSQHSTTQTGKLEFKKKLAAAATEKNYDDRLDDQIWVLGHIVFRKYRIVKYGMWLFLISVLAASMSALLERI